MQDASVWYQFCLEDSNELSGESVANFLTQLHSLWSFAAVVLDDLVGAVGPIANFEKECISFENLILEVRKAAQFDWGFLYCFDTTPTTTVDVSDHKLALEHADFTVRLADDGYIYVYTKLRPLFERLVSTFPLAEVAEVPTTEDLEIMW